MGRRLGASSSLRSVCMSCWTVCGFLGAITILSDSLEWYLLLPSHFHVLKGLCIVVSHHMVSVVCHSSLKRSRMSHSLSIGKGVGVLRLRYCSSLVNDNAPRLFMSWYRSQNRWWYRYTGDRDVFCSKLRRCLWLEQWTRLELATTVRIAVTSHSA
jgi:hypothetical protein